MEKERKLTQAEARRKERFEKISDDLIDEGFMRQDLIIDIVKANIGALVVMMPFIIVMGVLYYTANMHKSIGSFSLSSYMMFLGLFLFLIIAHELIHGITWSIFTPNHMKDIEFGVIWSAVTPYCTCGQPLSKKQFIIGAAMPTLILGFGLGIVSIVTGQFMMFLLAEALILGGGGDFLIIIKLLRFNSDRKEQLYYDHPYECGLVVFER